MKGHIPILVTLIVGMFSCSTHGVPEKKSQASVPPPTTPPALQQWMSHFFETGDVDDWQCRETTEEEPQGYYCTIQTHSGFLTLYCNSKYCDLVTLVHQAKWSKSIPNPGFAAPIFSKE